MNVDIILFASHVFFFFCLYYHPVVGCICLFIDMYHYQCDLLLLVSLSCSLMSFVWQLEGMETIYRTVEMKSLSSLRQFRGLKGRLSVLNLRYNFIHTSYKYSVSIFQKLVVCKVNSLLYRTPRLMLLHEPSLRVMEIPCIP